MTTTGVDVLKQFNWQPQPQAQALINELVADFLQRCPGGKHLAERMMADTGTRFIDWIDHLHVPRSAGIIERLKRTGFENRPQPGAPECFTNEHGIFPAVIVSDDKTTRIGIKVDSVADFAAVWRLDIDHPIEGEPHSQFRRVRAFAGDNAELFAIERHGYRGFEVVSAPPAKAIASQRHLENFRRRQRDFPSDLQAFAQVNKLVDRAIEELGVNWTCDLFFQAERDYWQRRNRAARVQKARQDSLGLGWANHDHHTYRSSRHAYRELMALQEKLGFKMRERFYAGLEAGWGAQVAEQHVTGITTFNDVDMSPEELMGDFAHEPMSDRDQHGTVGLWCGLHGEAILQAGMHHLECQFDWHALKSQLEREAHVKTMDPFTTFPYLRQAFTEGERWPVNPDRIKRLLEAKLITKEQAEAFAAHGAIGSHLENLERNDGFKGFNQTGVSDIISRTDPRKQHHALAGA